MKSVIKKYGVIVGGLGVSPVGVVSGWLFVGLESGAVLVSGFISF